MSEESTTTEALTTAPSAEWADIEWRIDSQPFERDRGSQKVWVCRWVPFLNATTVARLLDSWVGPEGWHDEYTPVDLPGVGHGVECALTVRGVTKRDVGVDPGGDAEMRVKGNYSDAFKRAGIIKWGVGRNVYALRSLWAVCGVFEKDGKKKAKETPESLEDLKRQYEARPI